MGTFPVVNDKIEIRNELMTTTICHLIARELAKFISVEYDANSSYGLRCRGILLWYEILC